MSKTISLLLLTAALISFTALTDVHGQKAAQPKLPDGPGKDIVQNACTECHDLQMVYDTGYNKQEWQLLVERMITAGANVSPDQAPVLVDYLMKNMTGEGPKPAKLIPGPVKVSFKEWGLPTKGSRPHDPWAYGFSERLAVILLIMACAGGPNFAITSSSANVALRYFREISFSQ